MSSVKMWVVGVAAGVAACGSVGAIAQDAPTFVVSRQSQTVQTPGTAGQSGISYVQTGGATSALKVYTDGFLFCGNPGNSVTSAATLVIAHEDQTLSPPHPWTFPTATDAPVVEYTDGTLSINARFPTSLTCLGTTDSGAVASGLTEGVFDNGYDSATETNYNHLVNWIPPRAFDWSNPDWTQVPVAACESTENQPAKIIEDVACSAVTGVRADTGGGAVRASSMWTSTDGVSFTYLFRVDARLGPQAPNGQTLFQIPALDSPDGENVASIVIQDAYEGGDAGHVGYLSNIGQYCTLTELPSVLNSSVCGESTTLTGPLKISVPVGAPPSGSGVNQAFYVAVTRSVQGGHPSLTTPVVAASVLMERSVTTEGGDKFSGDDVIFGFMPTSTGFPWMSGQ